MRGNSRHGDHCRAQGSGLLRRSPAMLPIPGTSSVAHLEDNVAAAAVDLSGADVEALTAAVGRPER
ncbi:MAG: hypothetical protein J0I34_31980 [Pseudonocardia sp.]|nr:hypothetical protein [Pseudonocardia sp.]